MAEADPVRLLEPSLRITHVVRNYPPGIGGMENFVRSLAERQAAQGHSVRVVTLNRIFDGPRQTLPPLDWRGGVEIVRVGFVGNIRYPVAPAILRHVRDSDVVHVHGIEFAADYLSWTQWWHRRPMVISTHGGFFHTRFARRLKKLYFATVTRATLRRYTAVLASSVQDAETFRTIAPDRTQVVENAVDVEKFAGFGAGTSKTMIYFGRIAPNKGVPRLLRWFALLHATDPEWRLIVAGKEMGVTFADLRRQATALGIAPAVEFHNSPSDAELRGLIERSRVYACASTYEGFGLAAVEAIAAGLYPLLSDIPAFRRTLDRVGFGTAIRYESDADTAQFRRDFAYYETDGSTREGLPERLRSFGWDRLLRDVEASYRRAAAQSGATSDMVESTASAARTGDAVPG